MYVYCQRLANEALWQSFYTTCDKYICKLANACHISMLAPNKRAES